LRGYMLQGLSRHIGRIAAYVVVAAVFTVLHAAQPGFALFWPVYAGVSLALSLLVDLTKSIWPAAIAHVGVDMASYVLLLFTGAATLSAPADFSHPDNALWFVATIGGACVVSTVVGLAALAFLRTKSTPAS
jgi:membrane protease YdiL (CAAX protease family)